MFPIQMVDLKRQYQKIKPEIDEAIQEVVDHAAFINGKSVQEFSTALKQYLQVPHVIPCANGTDALQIAMMALNLHPGDEVITPSFTYIATVEVIALLGLRPVFVDVDPQTFCLDIHQVQQAITPKTKAVVPVHLYGQSAPMEPLLELAKNNGLFVIEDNAQAIGSDYLFSDGTRKKTGTMGTIGCTSFFPSKNLGAFGDGGALFTGDAELAHKITMIANHGQRIRYYHDLVGCNSRLDTIQAAVLKIKLQQLNQYISARRQVADFYDAALGNHPAIRIPYRAPYTTHVFHQYTLQLEGADRNQLQTYLAEHQIPSMIYYPVPAHRQKMFSSFGTDAQSLPVTDQLTGKVLSLPIHTEMDTDQLQYITSHILNFLN
ncbi:MAG: DegT/DnrJ/EryC1/StrS family aminotransferase [Chitinophagaceae bacterium]